MAGVTKVNMEVAEGELKKVVASSESIQSIIASFKENASEVAGFCGKALDGVLERLTDGSPGSLTQLVKELNELTEELKRNVTSIIETFQMLDDESMIRV